MKSLRKFQEDSVKIHDANGDLYAEVIDIIKPEPLKPTYNNIEWEDLSEKTRLPAVNGSIVDVHLNWRGKSILIKMFFPQSRSRRPTREEVNSQLQKVYPGAKLWSYEVSDTEPGQPFLQVGD